MSRASESRLKYGVIGAGAVSKSFIGQLPAKTRDLGPVAGVSFRVASRIANSLRAGYAVRSADELGSAPIILFHSPPEQTAALGERLSAAAIDWTARSLIICDSEIDRRTLIAIEERGASVAMARQFGLPRQVAIEGTGRALAAANGLARALRLHVVQINPGASEVFDAAVTLATAASTPLIDRAAEWLRIAGLRDAESARVASALFEATARGYAHSGKQSWKWYMQEPDPQKLESEIGAAGPRTEGLFRDLLVYALDIFEKHPEVARALRARPTSK